MKNTEIVTRGDLPHWYVPGAAHFVTYRLANTIPAPALEELKLKRKRLLQQPLQKGSTAALRRWRTHKELFADYDRFLDGNRDITWLANPMVASMIRENLYHHHRAKYQLFAYCIMPNHVHVLLQPIDPAHEIACRAPRPDEAGSFVYGADAPCGEEPDGRSPLSSIMHSLKSYTANRANELLGRSGQFRQHESYDHWVRDLDEFERIVSYIAQNPVKAVLVAQAHDWYFSSAHDRFLLDGTQSGLLNDISAILPALQPARTKLAASPTGKQYSQGAKP